MGFTAQSQIDHLTLIYNLTLLINSGISCNVCQQLVFLPKTRYWQPSMPPMLLSSYHLTMFQGCFDKALVYLDTHMVIIKVVTIAVPVLLVCSL